jgi:hypothetical protein
VPGFRNSWCFAAPSDTNFENQGHWQVYCSSAAFRFEIPEMGLQLMLQEFQIGGTMAAKDPPPFTVVNKQP